MTFNAARLILARRRRGMTKVELAERARLSTRILTSYEAAAAQPSEETLAILARELKFPVEFFCGETELAPPDPDAASFRAYTSMSASRRDAVLSAGAFAFALAGYIAERFELPPPSIPDMHGFEAEASAEALRNRWGLGELSIRNMIHLLEAHGVRVFSLAEECRDVNAFSTWHADVPFVFLNTMKTAESSRFDAAHELGHLVLHRRGGPRSRDTEREADRFASAFLMPRGSVLAHAPRFCSIAVLVKLKKLWGVSALALAHRFHDLGVITDWVYRSNCIDLSKAGGRTAEIEGGERETSQVLNKVFEALRADGVSKRDVAKALSLPVEELNALVFGLVTVSAVPGPAPAYGGPTQSSSRRADLKLV